MYEISELFGSIVHRVFKKTMDRGRNPERLRYAVPRVYEWKQKTTWVIYVIQSLHPRIKKHSHQESKTSTYEIWLSKFHTNKNKNDFNLIVVFQYLHRWSIVKICRIVVQSILIWTHKICVRPLLCTSHMQQLAKYSKPHLLPGVHIYFTPKILRYIQYFAFLINRFYIWLLLEKMNELILN